MKKPCALLSGSTICRDDDLVKGLQKCVDVLKNPNNYEISTILGKNKIDLILMEITNHYRPSEIEIIKYIRDNYPKVKVILIDGNGNKEAIARAFAFGAKDLFKKPYKIDLIVERVHALFRH